MTILAGDIKLKKSAVMLDVDEGGGAPTSVVIVDGTSNNVFPDVSETDRALGRVNLRKVFMHVDTDNVDMFLGSNFIVSKPPEDPLISITAFSTGETFDTREDAVSRLEAYLNVGPTYAGYLYGNHIQGQDTLLVFQKTDFLPAIGATLVLTKREGYGDEHKQYVRVINAVSTLVSYADDKGDYTRYVLTLTLANTLDADYSGFDVSRLDYTAADIRLKTKISDTVVANAARYYGVSPLEEQGEIGDFTIKAESIYTQLVPSAQVETVIADSRTNQLSAAQLSTGSTVTQTISAVFSPSQGLFVGGQIAPGSLTLVHAGLGITLTDQGGKLMLSGSQVGFVDYENGLLTLSTDVFGIGGALSFTLTYSLAATPEGVNMSLGFTVTAENRSTSFVRTLPLPPAPGSMQVSYMAQGRWYVLRDAGDGALRGSDSGYGAGMVNFNTGTVSVTFGALPDVGSDVIYQWTEPEAVRDSTDLTLENSSKAYWVINTSGNPVDSPGVKVIEPGAVTIAWNDGTARTVTDNGLGVLTGYGTGSVDYSRGIIRMSPTTLPPPGTPIALNLNSVAKTQSPVVIGSASGTIPSTNIIPGSVSIFVNGQPKISTGAGTVNVNQVQGHTLRDDGAGGLLLRVGDEWIPGGTINYTTGDFDLPTSVTLTTGQALLAFLFYTFYRRTNTPLFSVEVTP